MVLQTVDTITTNDSLQAPSTTTYKYEGGEYFYNSPHDRKFAGFSKVITTDAGGNVTDQYFHQGNDSAVQLGEFLDDKAKINRVYREEKYDTQANLYAKSINKWESVDLGNSRNFAYISQSLQQVYDGNLTHKDKAQSFGYDPTNGNLIQQTDWGEVNGNDDGTFQDTMSDKLVTALAYATDGNRLVGLPSQELSSDSQNNKVAETNYYYDTLPLGQVTVGDLTKQEQWVNGLSFINSQKSYNQYGLLTQELDPKGNATTYTYDAYNLYPATVTNAKNQTTQMSYNYGYGVAEGTTDANNSKMVTTYDGLGRAIQTQVSDPANPLNLVINSTTAYDTVNFPQSMTKTALNGAGEDVVAITYLDGLGRVMQSKTEAEGAITFSMRNILYNALGQVQKDFLPVYTVSAAFENIDASNPGTAYTYDALGRVTQTTNTLGTTVSSYDDWQVTIIDPNNQQKTLGYDAQGNLVQVQEYLNGVSYATAYSYDAQKNLIKITDAKGNIRNFGYDHLGRKLFQEDLHTPNDLTFGTWSYTYDANSNLFTETDPQHRITTYTYDQLNRILSEDSNASGGVEVTYTYDLGLYGIGRLKNITTPALQKKFAYDILGRMTQETKIIDGKTYSTKLLSDLLGNLLQLTYPDGTQVIYSFNNASQIETVSKSFNGVMEPIVTVIDYAPTGAITHLEYANGVMTDNTFDPQQLYRLIQKTSSSNGIKLQDVSYTYDAVGNVLTLTEAADVNTARKAVYEYDDLYRLTKATVTDTANNQDYVHDYSYDILGNILSRSDVAGTYTYAGGDPLTSNGTTAHPHAVTKAGGVLYQYDLNGNLVSNGTWTHSWDYKNRLLSSTDGATNIAYGYDEAGERIKKTNLTTGGITRYINQYYEVEGAAGPEKHYFVGSLKVASETPVRFLILPKNVLKVMIDLFGAGSSGAGHFNAESGKSTGIRTSGDVSVPAKAPQFGIDVSHLSEKELRVLVQKLLKGNVRIKNTDAKDMPKTTLEIASLGTFEIMDLLGVPEYQTLRYEKPGVSDSISIFQPSFPDHLPKDDTVILLFSYPYLVYHSSDHLSSAGVDTDKAGALVNLFDYYPFGNVRIEESSGKYTNNFKYTGKELDSDTHLSYYGARYYDASIGRFISQDPWAGDITDPQSFNKYSYVRNNPLKYVDPDGRDWVHSATQFFQNQHEVTLQIGDTLTFGQFSNAFNTAENVGLQWQEAYNNGSLSTQTVQEGVGEIVTEGLKLSGTAFLTGVTLGEIYATGKNALAPPAQNVTTNAAPKPTPQTEASLSTNGLNLQKQLASEAQMAETGRPIIESSKLDQAARLSNQYGGNTTDWIKQSSSSFTANDATKFETHWYENTVNNLRVEFKTKLDINTK